MASSLNLDIIRKKLQTLQNSDGRNKNMWKPEAGKNVIRIVPHQFNKENPFIELYFHYNIGKKKPLSLYTFGEPDPIVEFSEKLQETGNSEDWKLGKKIEPKLRVYVPIIIRGKEKEGVKFWGFGKEIYKELMDIMLDPDYGDISDLTTGHDITVTYLTPEEAGNTYGKVSVTPKPKVSMATEDKEIATKIVKEQVDIFTIYPKPSYDDLRTMLEKWLNPEAQSVNEIDEKIEKARKIAQSNNEDTNYDDSDDSDDVQTSDETPVSTKDVEKTFDDLFD